MKLNLKSTIEIERERAIEEERKKFAVELKRVEELENIIKKKDVRSNLYHFLQSFVMSS